ncbi:MAG: alpha/beta hydrolase fold domain-containing protein [Limisphaerales bacterium]
MDIFRIATIALLLLVLNASAAEPRVEKDIEFANVNGHSLQLDVYLPAKGKPSHVVVWIHGGGWHKGSKERCEIPWLTDHGYAVASISYRLTDKAIFPAQIRDCKAAIRWLRANAGRFGYQTDKVAVAGTSAGGMLAALVGTSGDVKDLEGAVGGNLKHSSRVQAVVDFYGATDFVLRSKNQPHRANEPGSVVYKLLGGGADKEIEQARAASAITHVSADDPPFLVIHGAKDRTVLIDQSYRIQEVYHGAGLPLYLHVVTDGAHGGREFYSGECRERMVAFLDQVLKGN